MDPSVSLVEAYLHANGYMTVTEYPILERTPDGMVRTATDIDILAIRMPGAGRLRPTSKHGGASSHERWFEPDPALVDEQTDGVVDLIIAEVKEGKAELNHGARRPETIQSALRRFASADSGLVQSVADRLVRRGRVLLPEQELQARLIAFGSERSKSQGPWQVILLRDCFAYLLSMTRELDRRGISMHMKNPVMNILALMGKSGLAPWRLVGDDAAGDAG